MDHSITFWMSNAGFPALMVALNVVARLLFRLPISPFADWLLSLFAFDIIAMNNRNEFSKYAASPIFQNNWAAQLEAMLLISLISWLITLGIERKLVKQRAENRKLGVSAIALLVLALSSAFLDTWWHYSVFTFHKIS